jgi:hypothetical protein
VTRFEHPVCATTDLRILDARIADLRQAATLARLPAAEMDRDGLNRLKILSNRKDAPIGAAVRDCPDTGARLIVALWIDPTGKLAEGVEMVLSDPSRIDVLQLMEPRRLDGPKPDLGRGDALWIEHLASVLAVHRDRIAIPESDRGDTPFHRVSRLANVAARSTHRGGVLDTLGMTRAAAPLTPGGTIALVPPSPYSDGRMDAATPAPLRNLRTLGPARAIREDLASLDDIVAVAIQCSPMVNTISLAPYGTLHHAILSDDRDAMERLRDAADLAVDRVDLVLARDPTTLNPDILNRLHLFADTSINAHETQEVALALHRIADAVPNCGIGTSRDDRILFDEPASGASLLRTRKLSAKECTVDWIVTKAPCLNRDFTVSMSLDGHDQGVPVEAVSAESIQRELRHIANALGSASYTGVPDVTHQATRRAASLLDVVRDPDRTLPPLSVHAQIDPFGTLVLGISGIMMGRFVRLAENDQELAEWTGVDSATGGLSRRPGRRLHLDITPSNCDARYRPDDPARTSAMDRLRLESDKAAGLLPRLSAKALAILL